MNEKYNTYMIKNEIRMKDSECYVNRVFQDSSKRIQDFNLCDFYRFHNLNLWIDIH